jgi:tRNA (mo5U34)-methyltransferase
VKRWYHTIDLPDGSSTSGFFDTRTGPAHVRWPTALAGGRALDVGTFDGYWAFEMERRGAAEVIALDVDDPRELDWPYDERQRGPAVVLAAGSERGPGFEQAATALGSSVQRVNRSVYDLDPGVDGRFDVVLCGALLLHLRDPVRALERMREVCAGELVLVEPLDPLLDLVLPRIPVARFHRAWDEWWRVSKGGLLHMTRTAGFEVHWVSRRFLMPFGEGAEGLRPGRLNSLAARRPWERGVLFLALGAQPRAPRPSR